MSCPVFHHHITHNDDDDDDIEQCLFSLRENSDENGVEVEVEVQEEEEEESKRNKRLSVSFRDNDGDDYDDGDDDGDSASSIIEFNLAEDDDESDNIIMLDDLKDDDDDEDGNNNIFSSLNKSLEKLRWEEAQDRLVEEEGYDVDVAAGIAAAANAVSGIAGIAAANNSIGAAAPAGSSTTTDPIENTTTAAKTTKTTTKGFDDIMKQSNHTQNKETLGDSLRERLKQAEKRPANYTDFLRAQRSFVTSNHTSRNFGGGDIEAGGGGGNDVTATAATTSRRRGGRRPRSSSFSAVSLQQKNKNDKDDDSKKNNNQSSFNRKITSRRGGTQPSSFRVSENDENDDDDYDVDLDSGDDDDDDDDDNFGSEGFDTFDEDLKVFGKEKEFGKMMKEKAIPASNTRPTLTKPGRRGSDALQEAKHLYQSMRVLGQKLQNPEDVHAVDSMVYDLEKRMKKLDVDGHFKDKNNLQAPWYSVPIQRQRWNAQHTLPDSNYGSLFFDLFFIGAVYNIQEMLLTATGTIDSIRAILYFIGIFGPTFVTWETDVYYHSRYCVVDYAHRFLDVLRFVFVTTTVLFIQPIPELKNPQSSVAPFALTTSILLESIMHLLLNVEVYYKAQGDRQAIQNHTLRKIKGQLIPTSIIYLIAATIAGVYYFTPKYDNIVVDSLWSATDLPLTITAAGYILNSSVMLTRKIRSTNGSIDIRKTFVPNNIDYVISRYNDWFLLLLGEVVMAMVEITDSQRDYLVASLGAFTTIIIHTLKFESEPGQAHGHALWRNISNATCFSLLTQFLSAGLVLFGVSYKILLTDGRLGLSGTVCNIFVCTSLAWVLISLELLVMTHRGLTRTLGRLFHHNEDGQKVIYWSLIWITLSKIALFVFLLTIPLWTDNPDVAVVSGVIVVVLVALTRIIGWAFVFREEEIRNFVSQTRQRLVSKVSFVDSAGSMAGSMASSRQRVSSRRQRSSMMSSRISTRKGSSRKSSRIYNSIRRKPASSQGDDTASNNDDPATGPGSGAGSIENRSDASGSVTGMTSIRKRAEVYDEMFDAVVLIDLKGSIITANKTALDVFLYKQKSDLIGNNVSMLVGGKDGERHDGYLEAFNKKNKQHTQIGKQRVLKAKRSDGSEFPCIVGIKRTNNGKHLVGYIRDMTHIDDFNFSGSTTDEGDGSSNLGLDDNDDHFAVTNEGALQKRYKKHLARVLDDKSFDCIVVIDLYGVILGVNMTLVQEFGFRSKEELNGENISILMDTGHIPQDVHDGYLTKYREKFQKGEHVSRILGQQRQLSAKRKDGTLFKCIIGVHDIDGVDLLVGYIRNVENVIDETN